MNGETRHFKIGKWGAFRSKWERLLPDIIHRDMYDGLMTLVNGHISIDPVRLGEELRRLYPDEWEHRSMMEIIETHYGTAAVLLIESLI